MTTIGEVHIVLWVFIGHGSHQRKVGKETKKVTSELSLKGYRSQRLNMKKVSYFNSKGFAKETIL